MLTLADDKVMIVSFRTHDDRRPSKFIVLADDMRVALMQVRKPELKVRVSPIVTSIYLVYWRRTSISKHKRKKGEHMLRYVLVVSSLIGAILLAVPQVMSQGIIADGIRLCPGDFALCAASICTPTGETIEVKCE